LNDNFTGRTGHAATQSFSHLIMQSFNHAPLPTAARPRPGWARRWAVRVFCRTSPALWQ
jgi:hypothetical protein